MAMKTRIVLAWLLLLGQAVVPAWAQEKAPPAAGTVRLPLSDYRALLAAAGRGGAQPRPIEAAFVRSEFELTAEGTVAILKATLEIASLAESARTVALPDLGSVFEAEITGGGALVCDESGNGSVRIPPGGRSTLRLRSAPNRKEENGVVTLFWSVPASPSNHLQAILPKGFSDVALDGGVASIETEGSRVRVEGSLAGGETVSLSYAATAPKLPDEKLVASASESRLYRIGEETLSIGSRVHVEVLRGTLTEFAVEAPEDLRVVSVSAEGNTVTSFEGDPSRRGKRMLRLGNPVAAGGSLEVFWLFAREGKTPPGTLVLPEIALADFLRGEVAVAVVSARPMLLAESESKRAGYERIDELDLPGELKELTDSPVLYAARRIGTQPPRLALEVTTLPELAGLSGVIDRARLLTIVTSRGQRVDRWRLELQTRETLLRVALPEGEIWSALLDGKPFRPLREGRDLLVPMGRGASTLGQRVLEVVVAAPSAGPLPRRGEARFELPALPYPATAVQWDLFLPEKAEYRVAAGTVAEPPRPPEGSAPVAGAKDPRGSGANAYGSGNLSGRIVDPNGGALPGVTVTVTGAGGWKRSAVTDSRGNFQFANLPAGKARLRAELGGFNTVEQALDIRGDSNLSTTLPMLLAAHDGITVTAEAPVVDRTATSSAMLIDGVGVSGGRPAKSRKAPPPVVKEMLSDDERAALQRTMQAGVATIPVELPTTGKRIALTGYLLVEEAPRVDIRIRPVRRGWLW